MEKELTQVFLVFASAAINLRGMWFQWVTFLSVFQQAVP